MNLGQLLCIVSSLQWCLPEIIIMLDGIMRRMSSSHSVNASEDVASVGSDIPITSKEALSGKI